MASQNKGERPPRELVVPETMKIAALLAELMPPGSAGQPALPLTPPKDVADEVAAGTFSAPALQIEDLDDFEADAAPPDLVSVGVSHDEPVRASVPPLLPEVSEPAAEASVPMKTSEASNEVPDTHGSTAPTTVPESFPTASELSVPVSAPSLELPPTPVPPPRSDSSALEPSAVGVGQFLRHLNWSNDPAQPPLPTESPIAMSGPEARSTTQTVPQSKPHDPELVPLGNLSLAGFFALVNWTNDPQRVKQPRRADYGLDEQTLSEARKNPFYVIGKPRRPERDSVAEVLAEISWD
jgi:hypothetical protein